KATWRRLPVPGAGVLEEQPQAIELGRLAEDLYTQVSGHLNAARVSIYLGELGVAREHAASSLTLAEKLSDRVFLELTLGGYETVCRFEGVFQIARELSDRGLAEPRAVA
ncbi:MAG: hypothetical protein O6948_14305, partial [Deltaproteobacteria bacterium]|nr:hypothetical protein [Deltaproteobacteria bacterium]